VADTAVNPDRPCPHEQFAANVSVNRIEPDPGAGDMPKAFVADVTVTCAPPPDGCGEPFRFTGLGAGLSYAHPMVSVDETELRAPIRPASADPDFGLGLPGFAVRQV
jgi:hypothetical protein